MLSLKPVEFDGVSVWAKDGLLTVSTGRIERCWKWTGSGLVTVGLKDLSGEREWINREPEWGSDWSVPGVDGEQDAKLLSLTAEKSTDEGFTSEHIAVTAEIEYPDAGVILKYVIWVYPGAQGLRTQLYVKGKNGAFDEQVNRVDYLPVNIDGLQRRAIGYYSDTQNRHTPETHLLREELVDEAKISWANIFCVEDSRSGLAMVKESHKCVNEAGVNTGEFVADESGISNTGMLIGPDDILEDRYRACWASWTIVYDAGDDARELAIKQFDRTRFPIELSRDMYIKANTWGSGDSGRESRDKGLEVEVLKEIDSVADLGIDGLQIDDGWQQSADSEGAWPDGGIGWRPHPETYPDGWKNVKARAEEKGVRMGLWAISEQISLEELKWNYDQVGFWTWKLDFANLKDVEGIERNISKVREFILYTDHKAEASWDVTEGTPRYGYYWAREYGCMWLSNRKPNSPASVIPKPWLMLRENQEIGRYLNLNKFQLPVQNFERVNREVSDAYKHSHSYEVALGLMGIPVFFQTTYLYEDAARDEIRDLLALYKQHREEMFTSYVFAIGEEPTNEAWAGFQWYHPDRDSGYLMIFRELNNQETEKEIALRFLANEEVQLTDLRSGEEQDLELDENGRGMFSIQNPADFLFCRYEI